MTLIGSQVWEPTLTLSSPPLFKPYSKFLIATNMYSLLRVKGIIPPSSTSPSLPTPSPGLYVQPFVYWSLPQSLCSVRNSKFTNLRCWSIHWNGFEKGSNQRQRYWTHSCFISQLLEWGSDDIVNKTHLGFCQGSVMLQKSPVGP